MKQIFIALTLVVFGTSGVFSQGPNTNLRFGDSYAENYFMQDIDTPSESDNYAFTGYYNVTDIGFLVGATDNLNPAPFSLMMVNGWHITEKLGAGIGIGTEFYTESYMPVVLDIRYYLRKEKFSPYFFIQGGYNIGLDEYADEQIVYDHLHIWPGDIWEYPERVKVKGGFLLNPGIGIKNMFNETFGMIFNLSYRLQQLNYEYNENSQLKIDQNRLAIKIGIIFK